MISSLLLDNSFHSKRCLEWITNLTNSLISDLLHGQFLWSNSPTRAKTASLLRSLDHTRIHTAGRTLLIEWSACRTDLYLHTTHQTQQKNIHALSGIRTRNPSNRATAGLHLRPHGHRDWQLLYYIKSETYIWNVFHGMDTSRRMYYI